MSARGRFTGDQYDQLLKAINPRRVLHHRGQSHVSQQDVRAHLTRVFGFEGWDKEILELRCVRDGVTKNSSNKDVPAVTYLCRLRLTVYDANGNVAKVSEDVGTGTSPNLPSYGDAHDFASKNAVSYALKRCAIDIGDQFGLSLYNDGQLSAIVGRSLTDPRAQQETASDVQDGVPQQVSLGDTEDGSYAPDGADPQIGETEAQRVLRERREQDRAAEQLQVQGPAPAPPQQPQPPSGESLSAPAMDDLTRWKNHIVSLVTPPGTQPDIPALASIYQQWGDGKQLKDTTVELLQQFAAYLQSDQSQAAA